MLEIEGIEGKHSSVIPADSIQEHSRGFQGIPEGFQRIPEGFQRDSRGIPRGRNQSIAKGYQRIPMDSKGTANDCN
ncbi:MAG: hypothetical protein IPN69_16555 [Acidobacteria bacterium]|nr:hypothetical protein [Acidobacteriota bacterium]